MAVTGLMADFQSLMGTPETFAGDILLWIMLTVLVTFLFVMVLLIPVIILKR